jgi:carbonic anhydrase/acetyltransferase-like protein (isoleucine patch superfamily)
MPLYALDGAAPDLPPAGFYWVAPDAVLIGKVKLAEDASVWFGALLRGDNELISVGRGSNVQDLCVLHTDLGYPLTIGADCTIGHRVVLHGCAIGDNSLIGMGAIVMNGAVIGRNSIVGAGALVPEGRAIPDNSLAVGSPAKVIREIDAAGAEMLTRAAAFYTANWRRFAAGLKAI